MTEIEPNEWATSTGAGPSAGSVAFIHAAMSATTSPTLTDFTPGGEGEPDVPRRETA